MRYELFLRRTAALSGEELDAVKERVGVARLSTFRDPAGQALGFDLGVEVGEPDGANTLCSLAFAAAESHGLSVYDPQLGRVVTRAATAAISERYEQTLAFVTAGSTPVATIPPGSRASTRLWLTIGGGLLLLLLATRALTCLAVS